MGTPFVLGPEAVKRNADVVYSILNRASTLSKALFGSSGPKRMPRFRVLSLHLAALLNCARFFASCIGPGGTRGRIREHGQVGSLAHAVIQLACQWIIEASATGGVENVHAAANVLCISTRLAAQFAWTMECKRIVATLRPILKVLKLLKGETFDPSSYACFFVDVGFAFRAILSTCKQFKGEEADALVREYCQTTTQYVTGRSGSSTSNGVWSTFALVLEILVLARRPGTDVMAAAKAGGPGMDAHVPNAISEDFASFVDALIQADGPQKTKERFDRCARDYFEADGSCAQMTSYVEACEAAQVQRKARNAQLDQAAQKPPSSSPVLTTGAPGTVFRFMRSFAHSTPPLTLVRGSKENIDKQLAKLPACLSAAVRNTTAESHIAFIKIHIITFKIA